MKRKFLFAAIISFLIAGWAAYGLCSSQTTNLRLNKPGTGDRNWGQTVNDNMDLLDSAYGNFNSVADDLPKVYIYTGTFNSTTGYDIFLPKSVSAVSEYNVEVTPTSRAGAIGDIYVSKTTSNFTVHCVEANTTDTFSATLYYVGNVSSYGGAIYRKWYVSPDTGITDHGDTSQTGSLAWVQAQISTTPAVVELPGNKTYLLKQNLTLAANLKIIRQMGAIIDTDFSVRDGNYEWYASGAGTSEYYLQASGGGNPGVNSPNVVIENSVQMAEGNAGALAVGEWDWNDNDALGYTTIYVRLSDSTDPDAKSADYMEAGYLLTINSIFDPAPHQAFSGEGNVIFGTGALNEKTPQLWGALGDDSNDDTAAIKAAVAASLSTSGGGLCWPDGTYKITDTITIPGYTGFKIHGQSQGGTIIKQYTSNKPIFKFTGADTHTWEMSDFYFKYNTQQTSSETEGIAIYFGDGCGAYNFQIRRCQFDNVYKGIGLELSAGAGVNAWGCVFDHLYYNNTCTGPIIDISTTVPCGRPNISASHIYVRADSIENAQPIMRFDAVLGLQLDNIEYNLIDNGSTALELTSGTEAVIGMIRVEGATYETTADNFIFFDNLNAQIRIIEFADITINITGASEYFALLKSNGGSESYINIGSILFSGNVFTDGDAWILYGRDTAQRVNIGYIKDIESFALTNIDTTADASTIYVEDWNNPKISADNGDANLTIVVGDEQVQMFETTLTANRTVTLPEHTADPTNVFHGLTYKIVRNNATPGSFVLYVKNSAAATIGSIAADKNGAITVMYRRLNWVLIGDEEW